MTRLAVTIFFALLLSGSTQAQSQPDQWYGLEPITVCYATDAVHAEMTHLDTGEILFAPIATDLQIDQTEEGFQITNIVAFEHRAAPVLLPVVLSSSTQAQSQPIRIDAPVGVKIHLTGTDVLQDGAGVLYLRTRGPSERGEIVWTVQDGESVIVLEPGPIDAFGNGSLEVIGGVGYLVTVTQDQKQVVLFGLPGWTP